MLNSLFLVWAKWSCMTEIYRESFTSGILAATDSSIDTYMNPSVYYQIQEENTVQEMLQFCNSPPFPKIILDAFYISIPQLRGHQWREWAEIREHMLGARDRVSWPFTVAIRHTGQIHDNFHEYDMPNAAQHSIITISEKTATNNFQVWLFATLNLQLFNSLSPGFAFMPV